MIYKVKRDEAHYQQLTLDAFNLGDQLASSGIGLDECANLGLLNVELANRWVRVESSFSPLLDHPTAVKIPNISIWVNATLVLSEKAYAGLKLALVDFGEFLPINVNGFTYYIFNLLVEGKRDQEKTQYEWEDDLAIELVSLAFDQADIQDKHLFKSFEHGFGGVFCSEAFKATCEELDLDGLVFDENLVGG